MISENEKQVKDLIETKLTGNDKDELQLYHYSIERKLGSINLWFQNIEILLPNFIPTGIGTGIGGTNSAVSINTDYNPDLTITKISAYIDAFFMSGKSTLDTFAHEVRGLYRGNTANDIYFDNIIDLILAHHATSNLGSCWSSKDIKNLSWYKDLQSYRRASAHESIVTTKPTMEYDIITGEWRNIVLKLPLDPTVKPFRYNGKNFIDTGKIIKDEIYKLITESYDKILLDINNNKTKITI